MCWWILSQTKLTDSANLPSQAERYCRAPRFHDNHLVAPNGILEPLIGKGSVRQGYSEQLCDLVLAKPE